jgi:hypothetical protein
MRWGLNYLRQDLHEHREATARELESIRSPLRPDGWTFGPERIENKVIVSPDG